MNKKITNWRQCNAPEIQNHFKKFDKNSSQQFERLTALHLTPNDIRALFPVGKKNVDFNIMFGLDTAQSPADKFTFRPIITAGKVLKAFQDGAGNEALTTGGGAIIPYEIKEWLVSNWLEMDNRMLPDSFVACNEGIPSVNAVIPARRVFQRLHGYYFSNSINSTIWKLINQNRGQIQQFILHLGIDMNKFNRKGFFNFAPVFEVHIDNLSDKDVLLIHRLNLRSYQVGSKEVVYSDVLAPCPSTCGK
jgi:hypothetical protein